MKTSDNDNSLIDQYLRNKLTGEELESFKQRIYQEPDLHHEVEFQKKLIASIRFARKEELKSYIQANANKHERNNIVGQFKWYYLAAAAVFAGVSFFLIFDRNNDNTQLALSGHKSTNQSETRAIPNEKDSDRKGPLAVNENQKEVTLSSGKGDYRLKEGQPLKEADESLLTVDDAKIESLPIYSGKNNETGDKYSSNTDSIANDLRLKDTMIYAPVFVLNDYPSEDVTLTSEKSVKAYKSKSPQTKQKNETAGAKDETSSKPLLRVQFWQSPINFKGYKFFRNEVLLYGLKPNDSFNFFYYQGMLYLKSKGNYYLIKEQNGFNSFDAVSDKKLLEIFGK